MIYASPDKTASILDMPPKQDYVYASPSFTSLWGNKFSALCITLLDFLEIRDNNSLSVTSRIFKLRCQERADFYLQRLDTWDMNGCFTAGVYGRFFKRFSRWLDMQFTIRGVEVSFVTSTNHSTMTVKVKKDDGEYLLSVIVKPNDMFINPICSEDGIKVLEQNMKNNWSYQAYARSFDLVLPHLPYLRARAHMSDRVWVDGRPVFIPDLSLISMLSGEDEYSKTKLIGAIYRLLAAFARDSFVEVGEGVRMTAYELLKKMLL